jgi:uncharacterized protein involved in exopolysaccharide biosynthesis
MNDEAELDGALTLPAFVRDPIGALRRRWAWMLATLCLGLAAAALATWLWVPRYKATALVLISSQQIPSDFVRTTIPEDPFERINAMVGEVLSREKLAEVIKKYGLYPSLRAKAPLSDVAIQMRKDIEIGMDQGITGSNRGSARLLTIEYTAPSPKIAADVANDLAGLFTALNIQLRSQQAHLATEFMRRELERADQALRAQEAKITEFREKYRGELPDELDANLRRLDSLRSQRQSLMSEISATEDRITTLSSQPGQPLTPELQLEKLRAQLNAELATKTEAHPDVIALRHEIAAAEKAVQRAQASSSSHGDSPALGPSRQLNDLRAQLAETERSIHELDARVARTPQREEAMSALDRQVKVLQENYTEALRKVKEAELAESLEAAQQGERFSISEPAVPPTTPKIARWKVALGGVAAALGLSLLVGVFLELRDPVIVTADQIEAEARGAAVLGSLPVLG